MDLALRRQRMVQHQLREQRGVGGQMVIPVSIGCNPVVGCQEFPR